MGMKKGLMLGIIGMALMDSHTCSGYDIPKVKGKSLPKPKSYNPKEAIDKITQSIEIYIMARNGKKLNGYLIQGFMIYAINEKNAKQAIRKIIATHTGQPNFTLQDLKNQIKEQEA